MADKVAKLLLYPVTIKPCEEGGYFADCPVFQGCHAEGETFAEVIENIEDVIKMHLELRKQYKEEFIPGVTVRDKENINVSFPILIRA